MPTKTSFSNHLKIDKIIFALSIFVCAFWIVGTQINVYTNAVVGAIFELAWLPIILLSFLLPIICIIRLLKNKFSYRELPLYSLLISATTMVFISLKVRTIQC